MEEKYTKEQLEIINSVVDKMNNKGSINGADIIRAEYFAYDILCNDKWFKAWKSEQGNYIDINKTQMFDAKLAGGTFSERYNRKIISLVPQQVNTINNSTIINSNVAIGNNINQTLNVTLFNEAIEQIKNEKTLSEENKNEIIEILEDIKDAKEQDTKFSKTLTRGILKWTVKLIELGGAVATIFQTLPA